MAAAKLERQLDRAEMLARARTISQQQKLRSASQAAAELIYKGAR